MEIASIIAIIALLFFAGKALSKFFDNSAKLLDTTGEGIEFVGRAMSTGIKIGDMALAEARISARSTHVTNINNIADEAIANGVTTTGTLNKSAEEIYNDRIAQRIAEGIASAPSNTTTSDFVPQT